MPTLYDDPSAQAFVSLTDQVKNQAVDAIKTFFLLDPLLSGISHDGTPYSYLFNENPDISKIYVYKEYPEVERKFPSILVGKFSGRFKEVDLHQKGGPKVDDSDSFNITQGLIEGSVDIVVESTSSDERTLLRDIVGLGFVDSNKFRVLFAQRGLNLLPPFAELVDESSQVLTSLQKAYNAVIRVSVQGAWKTYRTPPPLPTISATVKAIEGVRRLTGGIFS